MYYKGQSMSLRGKGQEFEWASGNPGISDRDVTGFHCLCLLSLILTRYLLHSISMQTGFLCVPVLHGRTS